MMIRAPVVALVVLSLVPTPAGADDYDLLWMEEIVAVNVTGIADDAGDHDPWLELHNGRSVPTELHELFLSDDLADPLRWPLPQGVLPPNSRVVIWLDGEPQEGSWHASILADPQGGMLALYDAARGEFVAQLASVTFHYGPLGPDAAFGLPAEDLAHARDIILDGHFPTYLAAASPGDRNAPSDLTVVLNEVLADGVSGSQAGFIELRNGGTEPVYIGGWSVTAGHDPLASWSFPAGTLLAPHACLAVSLAGLGFAVEPTGTFLVLTRPWEPHGVDAFPPVAFAQASWGRLNDYVRTGPWAPCRVPSPGIPNLHVLTAPETPAQATAGRLGVMPNPLNPRTVIRFYLPVAGSVRLAVYDVAGRLVRILVDGELPAGRSQAVWDGRDASGRALASGSYFARLTANGRVETVRMELVK